MTSEEIQEHCISSSQKYFEYLKEHNLGVVVNQIAQIQIEGNEIELILGRKLHRPDRIVIHDNRTNEDFLLGTHFEIVSNDVENHRLVIQVCLDEEGNRMFAINENRDYEIRDDLKFLVENVESWHENHQLAPFAHDQVNEAKIKEWDKLDAPDPDQKTAIEKVLANQFSYVWGPPGSGKTKMVLTNCVFHYLSNSDERVLIGVFAPTNNALEVTMGALLENADLLGFDRNKFLRLGYPSKEFVSKYPEVCEKPGIERELKNCEDQLEVYKKVLCIRSKIERGKSALGKLAGVGMEFQNYVSNKGVLQGLSDKKEGLEVREEKIVGQILYRTKKFMGGEDSEDVKQIQESILAIRKEIENRESDIRDIRRHVEALIDELREVSPQIVQDLDLEEVFENRDETVNLFHRIQDKNNEIENWIADKEKEIEKEFRSFDLDNYSSCDSEELKIKQQECEETIKKLKSQTVEERLKKEVVVLGATLDGYVGKYKEGGHPQFQHVFVDEAGYVPLVKSLALRHQGCLFTLLGDHKQLPPICEMNRATLNQEVNKDVKFLWAKPSLFAKSIFLHEEDELYEQTFDCLQDIKPLILRTTHRFGPNMANILDEFVYGFGFKSNVDEEVNCYVLNAYNEEHQENNENQGECDLILSLINNGKVSTDNSVILTPYKNQVALLDRVMRENNQNVEVMTIHRSQGREWNNLILSVVDGSRNRPWFTDSTNLESRGLAVLNTAISRVKKNLYIVCEKDYWLKRHDAEQQLLSRLVQEAKDLTDSVDIF